MDCAKCRGDSEGRNLRFTKPPGLRLNMHRVHNKDRSVEPFQSSNLVLNHWEVHDPPSGPGRVTVDESLRYGGQKKEEHEAAGSRKDQRSDAKPGLWRYPSRWSTSIGILRANTTHPIEPERRLTTKGKGISWSSLWSSLKMMSW